MGLDVAPLTLWGDDVLFLRRNRGIIGIFHSATGVEVDQDECDE